MPKLAIHSFTNINTFFSLKSLKNRRKEWGLLSTRQQDISTSTILMELPKIRKKYPQAGTSEVRNILRTESKMRVSRLVLVMNVIITFLKVPPRSKIEEAFSIAEPELVKQRKAKRLKRKRFWAAGVNDLWTADQHDKWQRHGCRLHVGLEPYSGFILWLKVWWTNSNPRLIAEYYLDTIEELGCAFSHYIILCSTNCCLLEFSVMPLITQTDKGSENFGIANSQTALRHWHDPTLEGTVQHRWTDKPNNVKPEILWSQLRRRFSPGFENLFEQGQLNGWYDPNDPLHAFVPFFVNFTQGFQA